MNFITYYTISGVIWAIICAVKYKDISKQENVAGSKIVKYVGIEIFVLLNFFIGFLNIPICIPIMIRGYFLTRKLEKLREENKRLRIMRDELLKIKKENYGI